VCSSDLIAEPRHGRTKPVQRLGVTATGGATRLLQPIRFPTRRIERDIVGGIGSERAQSGIISGGMRRESSLRMEAPLTCQCERWQVGGRFRVMRSPLLPCLFASLLTFAVGGCSKIQDGRPQVAQEGGGIPQLDAENGLPNAQLGAPLASFEGLTTEEELGAWGTYRRKNDRMRYQGRPIEEILYNFYKGKLYSIRMEIADTRTVKGLLVHLYSQYGPESNLQRRRYSDYETTLIIREWDGQKVDLVFKYADDFSGGTLIWVDSKTWNELNAGRAAANRELNDAMSGSILNLDFD